MPATMEAKADLGHAEHTKRAATQGLRGAMPRPIQVTMIGAGSFFCLNLVNDITSIPRHRGGTIALVDIDADRLDRMARLIRHLLESRGQEHDWRLISTTDRREVLPGSDYVVNSIEVSGLDCVAFDYEIPLKYGVDQCIGDTVGPGGLFKGLRTIPVFLGILKDCEELCPQALVLNYTNPMGMLCVAAFRTRRIPVVGLCHSVQGSSQQLAGYAEVPYEEMDWECAGINHLAWFTRATHKGRDLYSFIREKFERELYGPQRKLDEVSDKVRKDMTLHFGAYITESSGHLSEYLPYYRKRRDLIDTYAGPRYDGECGFYAHNWPSWRQAADDECEQYLAGTKPLEDKRSWEYASWIIEAREKDVPYCIYGNVYNQQKDGSLLISNLPGDSCVEVATMIDAHGFNPTAFGALPPQMAAISGSNAAFINLAAQAAVERSKEMAIHALMLDPLTSAVCSPREIQQMTLELFAAESRFLADYR